MTTKPPDWRQAWQRLPNGRIRHFSGLEFTVTRGAAYTDINAADDTLQVYQVFEAARGVPPGVMIEKILKLNKEAARWHQDNV